MPIYDFKCKKCNKRFSVTLPISKMESAKCPKCGSKSLSRVFETFTAITGKKS